MSDESKNPEVKYGQLPTKKGRVQRNYWMDVECLEWLDKKALDDGATTGYKVTPADVLRRVVREARDAAYGTTNTKPK